MQGLKLGIDFTGGTLIELGYEKTADLEIIRSKLATAEYEGANVQYFGSDTEVLIQLEPQATSSAKLSSSIIRMLGEGIDVRRVEFVGYKKVEQDKIKEELANFAVAKKDGSTSIVIDHTFDVKGVGTVALGKVLSGKITQYDKINHYPSEIEAMVKSIQMHDDDVKESISPARVGLSLKNIKHDEITRGDILSNDASIKTVTEITINFKQNQFFKATLAENQMCLVNVGLQIKAAKFASVSPMKLIFEKPVIIMPDDVCVLLKPESNTVRIIGSGVPQ